MNFNSCPRGLKRSHADLGSWIPSPALEAYRALRGINSILLALPSRLSSVTLRISGSWVDGFLPEGALMVDACPTQSCLTALLDECDLLIIRPALCTALHCTAQHCIVLHSAALCCIELYCVRSSCQQSRYCMNHCMNHHTSSRTSSSWLYCCHTALFRSDPVYCCKH